MIPFFLFIFCNIPKNMRRGAERPVNPYGSPLLEGKDNMGYPIFTPLLSAGD